MTLVLSHLTGNANVKAALHGLHEAGLLGEFHVSIAAFPGSMFDMLGSVRPFSEIKRRRFDAALKPYTRTWGVLEFGRVAAPKVGLNNLVKSVNGPFFIDKVVRNFDRHVSLQLKEGKRKGINGVYGYEDTTIHSFRVASELQLHRFYDLPIGYWRAAHRMLSAEYDRWPEWSSTLKGLQDPDEKLKRKDEELSLANLVFVASSFTAKTLQEFPGVLPKIKVIPYGFPPVYQNRAFRSSAMVRPLKLLFVGSLSQRKGIADLFAAVTPFGKRIELTIVGQKTTDDCAALDKELTKHRWIPSLAHDEVLKLMRQNDILVFPSLFEGFGLVITEAMSQGVPVITTERTIGPDIIKNGENGWLIRAGATLELQSTIEQLLLAPAKILEVGRAAAETAKSRTWKHYGAELAFSIKDYFQKPVS